jgi:hypothetical protein
MAKKSAKCEDLQGQMYDPAPMRMTRTAAVLLIVAGMLADLRTIVLKLAKKGSGRGH